MIYPREINIAKVQNKIPTKDMHTITVNHSDTTTTSTNNYNNDNDNNKSYKLF